eukprot:scaffold60647_cov51-Cyclotella_meneghiniana.AAC.6
MNGNLRGNGCSDRGRPPRANRPPPSVIWMNAKRGDDASVVRCELLTMLWGYGRQVIVTHFNGGDDIECNPQNAEDLTMVVRIGRGLILVLEGSSVQYPN